MAHKKKGLLTFSAEWAKHLRKDMKKVFWSGERSAEKKMMNLEKEELNEVKNLEWQLEELIITLISISLPSNEQTNIYGIGIASDEMIEDINSYFTLNKERFLQFGLLNKTEINEINRIEEELDLMLQELKEEDWFDISSNNRWKNCRLLARDILNKIGKGNLKLVVQHENEYDNEGNITIQKTKTRLE